MRNAEHARAILAALDAQATSSAITRLITGEDEIPPCYFCEDGQIHTPAEHADAVTRRAEFTEAAHRAAERRQRVKDSDDLPF